MVGLCAHRIPCRSAFRRKTLIILVGRSQDCCLLGAGKVAVPPRGRTFDGAWDPGWGGKNREILATGCQVLTCPYSSVLKVSLPLSSRLFSFFEYLLLPRCSEKLFCNQNFNSYRRSNRDFERNVSLDL